MSMIELHADAYCAVAQCPRPPVCVRHVTQGVYEASDPHFCEQHRDVITDTEVPIWTSGWEAGYRSGLRRAEEVRVVVGGLIAAYPDGCDGLGCGGWSDLAGALAAIAKADR